MDQYPPSQFLPGCPGQLNPSIPVTIGSGQTTSSIINCGGATLCGILFPPAFTGTEITFEASVDGTNFYPVHNTYAGTPLQYIVDQGTYCAIAPEDFYGINFLKIVSGSSEAALRTLYAAVKGF